MAAGTQNFAGHIKLLQRDKGYGFIGRPGGQTDIFFHVTAVEGDFADLNVGDVVIFDVSTLTDRPRAEHVQRCCDCNRRSGQ